MTTFTGLSVKIIAHRPNLAAIQKLCLQPIETWDPNVCVKIPMSNTRGESMPGRVHSTQVRS